MEQKLDGLDGVVPRVGRVRSRAVHIGPRLVQLLSGLVTQRDSSDVQVTLLIGHAPLEAADRRLDHSPRGTALMQDLAKLVGAGVGFMQVLVDDVEKLQVGSAVKEVGEVAVDEPGLNSALVGQPGQSFVSCIDPVVPEAVQMADVLLRPDLQGLPGVLRYVDIKCLVECCESVLDGQQ